MCGIFGIWNKTGESPQPDRLRSLSALLAHRGPDAEGCFVRGSLGLAHRRLKIIDLSSAADQPFTDSGDALVFNGEIFNHRALREELAPHFPFRTRSDTEVLFRALQHWGKGALDHVDGQFAFAFYSGQAQTLLLARDHVGICPLYTVDTKEYFAFSSEIKPLLALVGPRNLDPQGVLDYFAYRYGIQNGHTLFDGITRHHPAHFTELDLRSGELMTGRYWRMSFLDPLPEATIQEQLNALLDGEFRKQVAADVPVGLFLSGGVDSRAVLHGVVQAAPPLDAYTLTFSDNDTELAKVESLKQRYAFKNHVIRYSASSTDGLCPVLASLEEPFGDVIVCANALLAEQASRCSRVVLSGEGGDESFFGYDHQHALLKLFRYNKIPGFRFAAPWLIRALPSRLLARLSRFAGTYGATEKEHLASVISSLGNPADAYLRLARIFSHDQQKTFFTPEFLATCEGAADEEPIRKIFAEEADPVRALLRVELEQTTLIINLLKQDRLCMAHSVEARVPLVSRGVLDLVGRISSESLATMPVKRYLQQYAKQKPVSKEPFSVANSPEYVRQVAALWERYVRPENVARCGFFQPDSVAAIGRGIQRGGLLDLKRAMVFVVFFAWLETFKMYLPETI